MKNKRYDKCYKHYEKVEVDNQINICKALTHFLGYIGVNGVKFVAKLDNRNGQDYGFSKSPDEGASMKHLFARIAGERIDIVD